MDPKVAILMESLECSKEEAEMLLEASEGDIEKAIKYYNMIAKEYMVLALKIEANRISNLEGYFFVLANGKKGDIEEIEGAVIFKKQEDIDITVDWEAFREVIRKLKKEPTFDNLETDRLRGFLEKALNPSIINVIYKEYQKGDLREIREKLDKIFSEYFTEEIDFSYNITLISSLNLKKTEEIEEKEENKEKEKKSIDIYVNVLPVVDPVKGKPVEKLTLGDKIYVKIVEDKPISEAVGKELNRTVDDIKDIAPCTLRKMEKTETGSFELEVVLREGIIGKTIVKPDIRIKLVEEQKQIKEEKKELFPMLYIYFTIGVLVIVAIIIVIFILK